MGFSPLILLVLAVILLSVATFLILVLAFADDVRNRGPLGLTAIGLMAVALLLLFTSTWLGVGIDQKALAKSIADDIRSAPLDVQVTKAPPFDNAALAKAIAGQLPSIPSQAGNAGNAPRTAVDENRLANAIAERLRAAPLDVQVTKAPPFDNAALARAIAEQLPSRTPALPIDSRALTDIGVLALVTSILVMRLKTLGPGKPFWKDGPTLATIVIGILTILATRYWTPPPDPTQLMVSFDNGGRGSTPAFFDASPGKPISFDPANESPMGNTVCEALKTLHESGSTVAIVVGSHDQQPLSKAAVLRFSSNPGLARQRAEAVKRILLDKARPCKWPSVTTVIAVSDAPLNVGVDKESPSDREKDRTVKIYGLAAR